MRGPRLPPLRRSSSEFSDRSTGGDTSSDDEVTSVMPRRKRRSRRRENGDDGQVGVAVMVTNEDILKTVDKMTETIKDSLWVAQRRASKVVQDTLPRC